MPTDPRAERTRDHIRAAVVALAEEGEGAPTVSDVARRAGVNRSSFYAHFDSLEQVALEMLDESLASIAELGWQARAADRGDGAQDLLALVEHVAERRRTYAAVLTGTEAAPHAQVRVGQVLSGRFEQAFTRYGATEVVDTQTVNAAAIGVGAAMAALITAWLRGDLDCTPSRLAEHLADVLPAWTHELHRPRPGAGSTGESHE